ncbi:MAG: glycosyltransferase family 1 protein [Methanobacterium sp.]|nr:glycosyltransferase family 1 protein [Methanobacterium sp.]
MKLTEKKKNSLAIIGSRGIPNNYGGFECFTENISQKLTEKDYDVYVSCEHPDEDNPPEKFHDVNLFYFPIRHPRSNVLGMLYEILYDAYSLIYASLKADQIYMLGYSASLFFFIPKLFGKKLYLNPDGFEWKRNKFSGMIKFMLKIQERMGVFWADKIVADSMGIKRYYDNKYGKSSKFIAYGVNEIPKINWNKDYLPETLMDNQDIESNYWLLVARLEPENNIHTIVEGYIKSETKKPLVIVGNFLNEGYEKTILDMMDGMDESKQVIFTGGIYNQKTLNMLRQNCFGYLHGHSVGGTNPSLIEAMAMKNVLLTHKNQFNEEVCQDTALHFQDSNELKTKMDDLDKYPEKYEIMKTLALFRVNQEYSWEKIVSEYDDLFATEHNKQKKQYTPTKIPISRGYNSDHNSK